MQIEKLNNIATDKDISFNQLVIQCCEFALEHLKEPYPPAENNKN